MSAEFCNESAVLKVSDHATTIAGIFLRLVLSKYRKFDFNILLQAQLKAILCAKYRIQCVR